jgi:hypothetical protein
MVHRCPHGDSERRVDRRLVIYSSEGRARGMPGGRGDQERVKATLSLSRRITDVVCGVYPDLIHLPPCVSPIDFFPWKCVCLFDEGRQAARRQALLKPLRVAQEAYTTSPPGHQVYLSTPTMRERPIGPRTCR